MKTKLIAIPAIIAILVNTHISSMQPPKEKNINNRLKQIKTETAHILDHSRVGPNATILAENMINSVGIDAIVKDSNLYATSGMANKNIRLWCTENPSTCEEMKVMLPYALRYETAKKIEGLIKNLEYAGMPFNETL